MVALPGATANGQVIFAKNSDRPQEECQPLVMRPSQRHTPGSILQMQFVSLLQASVTYRHVGSKPWWCQGYEHGFNEHQVVIGNEALPSRLPEVAGPKLIGMEILRLALERSRSAAEAVQTICGLVEKHGQGKFKNEAGVRTYDNIYLCADPREAYIVECAGHDWAVRRVRGSATGGPGYATISNIGMIGADADRVSATASEAATRAGLIDSMSGRPFVWADVFADRGNSASGIARQCRSQTLLGMAASRIDARTMIRTLSDHSDGQDPDEPWVEDVRGPVSLCVHRLDGPTPGVSAASLVADLCADGSRLPIYWCGMYSPCMTLFFPVFIEGELPAVLSLGGEKPSDDSPWWMFYRLTHDALRAGPDRRASVRAGWRTLQDELFESACEMAGRAREMIDGGRPDAASRLVTTYMEENTSRLLGGLRDGLRNPVAAK